MKRLQDKIAVVTGGNGVLGGAIAKGFAEKNSKGLVKVKHGETAEEIKPGISL